MLKHIVYLKMKNGVTESDIEKMYESLENLQLTIPQILNFQRIHNVANEGRSYGYTHEFIVDFQNRKSRDEYLRHPDHIGVSTEHVLKIADPLVFDYEILDK